MATSPLKPLLKNKSEGAALLQQWTLVNQSAVCITNSDGEVLFGDEALITNNGIAIDLHHQTVGFVHAGEHGLFLSNLLSALLQKETDRKKLGTEVLHLYQELNVIYNFSEKLAATIDSSLIAAYTLEQAMHAIPCESGVLIRWNETTKTLEIPANIGISLFNHHRLQSNLSLLYQLGYSGHSAIVENVEDLKQNGILKEDVKAIMYAALKGKHRIFGAVILATRTQEFYTAGHLKLLVTLALQSSAALESALLFEKNMQEAKERELSMLHIHNATRKFVPEEFLRSLGKDSITEVQLGDQVEKIVTVLFTDIRDFTTLSESMTPAENFEFVSAFNKQLGPIIRHHKGFINQYLGDSIMALFPRHPFDALRAAVIMQQAISKMNEQRGVKGLLPIVAGIGMHTGPLIMGITGDEKRLDAATISDTVNTAARIESLTKNYKAPILLSESTYDHLPEDDQFFFRYLGRVSLKGKNNKIGIWQCLNESMGIHLTSWVQVRTDFEEGIKAIEKGEPQKASVPFQKVLSSMPDDRTSAHLLDLCLEQIHQQPRQSVANEENASFPSPSGSGN
jgi:class 3 adenylate cyclase